MGAQEKDGSEWIRVEGDEEGWGRGRSGSLEMGRKGEGRDVIVLG